MTGIYASLILFNTLYTCYFMLSLSDDKQADVIDAFNTTSGYFDDILNINNVYFDNKVSQIYLSELQLNKANTTLVNVYVHLVVFTRIAGTS